LGGCCLKAKKSDQGSYLVVQMNEGDQEECEVLCSKTNRCKAYEFEDYQRTVNTKQGFEQTVIYVKNCKLLYEEQTYAKNGTLCREKTCYVHDDRTLCNDLIDPPITTVSAAPPP
jgi:hypothetical protein